MKNIAKIFSILFLIASTLLTISVCFPNMVDTNSEMFVKTTSLLTKSIIPILAITVCSISFERKNESYLERIIMAYMFASIIIFALTIFLPLKDINETLYNVVNQISTFISSSHLYLFAISLLDLIKPNNVIAKGFKITAFGAIGVNLIAQIWLKIKIELVEKLPNVYGHEGFNFASIYETSELTSKIFIVSIFIEIIAIISAFLTNYAFEETTIESESIDYDELKKQADEVAKFKINETYNKAKPEEALNVSVPKEKGLMNINNQLGKESNVGQVTSSANLPKSYIEKSIPTANGPIVNEVINTQAQNIEKSEQNKNLINPALTINQNANQSLVTNNNSQNQGLSSGTPLTQASTNAQTNNANQFINPALTINQNTPNTNFSLNNQGQTTNPTPLGNQNINQTLVANNNSQNQGINPNNPLAQGNTNQPVNGTPHNQFINPAFTINQGLNNDNNNK